MSKENIVDENNKTNDNNVIVDNENDDTNEQSKNLANDSVAREDKIENKDKNTQFTKKNEKEEVTGFLAGGEDELNHLLEILNKRAKCVNNLRDCTKNGNELEQKQNKEKELLEDELKTTLKKTLEEATAIEDKEIKETMELVKKEKSDREKAKDKEMRERFELETKDLSEDIKECHKTIKKNLRENGLPIFCDSDWFYLMFCPQNIMEWFIKITVCVLGIIVIPFIILEVVNPWWFWKVVWFIVFAIIEVGVYMTIYLVTKDKDNGTLEEMREYREKIVEDKKKISKIKNDIKKDPDESRYNLGKYDEKILELQTKIEDCNSTRQQKLNDYEETTKPMLTKQINDKHNEIIDKLQEEIDEKLSECNEIKDHITDIDKKLQNNYECYLTKENLNVNAINTMIEMIHSGKAQNISDALQLLKK